jgi:hypothetical protein
MKLLFHLVQIMWVLSVWTISSVQGWVQCPPRAHMVVHHKHRHKNNVNFRCSSELISFGEIEPSKSTINELLSRQSTHLRNEQSMTVLNYAHNHQLRPRVDLRVPLGTGLGFLLSGIASRFLRKVRYKISMSIRT